MASFISNKMQRTESQQRCQQGKLLMQLKARLLKTLTGFKVRLSVKKSCHFNEDCC